MKEKERDFDNLPKVNKKQNCVLQLQLVHFYSLNEGVFGRLVFVTLNKPVRIQNSQYKFTLQSAELKAIVS